jgi:hypothetical protein
MGAYRERNIAVDNLKKLTEDPSKVLFIHYTVSKTYDDDYGQISPIITCIVVKSLDNHVDKQFAIHFEADKAGIPIEDIQDSYRELELRILKAFNEFVKRHNHCVWVHWEMKNIHFGFEAIKHRFEKIFGSLDDYSEISSANKFNLKTILEGMYGENFVAGPDELKNLLLCNNKNLNNTIYLNKEVESSEFETKHFDAVNNSVDFKVDFIRKASKKLVKRKLKVTSRNNYAIFIESLGHPLFNLFAFIVGTLLGILGIYLSH